MAQKLSHLKPNHLWKYFEEISRIPRCSRHEEGVIAYLEDLAKTTGNVLRKDDVGNIVIEVPATPGHENARTIVLQGHMDMVCEKNSDTDFDFSKDPIDVLIDGDWVTANGTTLGADNGIGMAAGLAAMEDKSLVHGPLELLFTTDEETGLNGAMALESNFLKGRILLNLDSEEEGSFSIGCAGGGGTQISLPIVRKQISSGVTYQVTFKGLSGGHSGMDINTGRGNANQLLARILHALPVGFKLISIDGGSKHNAISREAVAIVKLVKDEADAFKRSVTERFEQIRFEYKAVEKNTALIIEITDDTRAPMDDANKKKFLSLLVAMPHGVMHMSQEIAGLVETSTNMAIVKTLDDNITIFSSTRSSIATALEAIRDKIRSCADLCGGVFEKHEGYPAWTPNLESPLLTTMKNVYREQAGKEAGVMALHAGLECGIIGERFPGMDMISFGPDLHNPHSPDERVHIASVERFWNLLVATLKELA
ncbi:aminoacyl-histidine dipeptidase [bacterium]|nr:aminoacyl-histidine dipeptidase [bacterium]